MASFTASMENVFRQRLAEISQDGKSYSTFSKEQYFTAIDDLKNAIQQTGTKPKKLYYLLTAGMRPIFICKLIYTVAIINLYAFQNVMYNINYNYYSIIIKFKKING